MTRPGTTPTSKRVPIALSVLAAVLALLGAHQTAFRTGTRATGQSVQMASAMVTSPQR
ncbi:MAG TPA: hypothetical protein VFY72_13160 [Beijerinckiaceae bacterium]|nr:hypothetical protein [Beijerinckiaceae bacterium]